MGDDLTFLVAPTETIELCKGFVITLITCVGGTPIFGPEPNSEHENHKNADLRKTYQIAENETILTCTIRWSDHETRAKGHQDMKTLLDTRLSALKKQLGVRFCGGFFPIEELKIT